MSGGFWANFTIRNSIIAVISTFFLVQIVSLILNSLFPSLGVFRGGPIIIIMLLCATIMSLFLLAIKITDLKKEQIIFIVIVFGAVAALYYYLPILVPSIFSISPEASQTIKQTVGQIFSAFGG
jgi:hypothetical protein